MKRKPRIFWWLVAGPFVVVVAISMEAYPFLATTRYSGAKVLVVEGWLDPAPMDAAARLALDRAYTHIYTTGTIRPFTYYLLSTEGIAMQLRGPASGELGIEVAGAGVGAGFILIADGDTLLDSAIATVPRAYYAHLTTPVHELLVKARDVNSPSTSPEIFIQSFSIGGVNV
ncbi:MAG: hypothetical protein ABI373_06250, partial [Flavobacteriales bacterium]